MCVWSLIPQNKLFFTSVATSVMDFYSSYYTIYNHDGALYLMNSATSFKDIHDEYIKKLDGNKGLDVGCGPGALWTKYYRGKGFIMTPVDKNDQVVYAENAYLYCAPEALSFREYEFDFAICSCMVQHLDSWEHTKVMLEEIHRVIRPSGAFIFIFKEGHHDTLVTLTDNKYTSERTFRVYDLKEVLKFLENKWTIIDVKNGMDEKRMVHSFIFATKSGL
jgi:ubiquinone/menaquinone biosynthesis C-methylase UbiE